MRDTAQAQAPAVAEGPVTPLQAALTTCHELLEEAATLQQEYGGKMKVGKEMQDAAALAKSMGNDEFKAQNWTAALERYCDAVSMNPGGEAAAQSWSNVAATLVKIARAKIGAPTKLTLAVFLHAMHRRSLARQIECLLVPRAEYKCCIQDAALAAEQSTALAPGACGCCGCCGCGCGCTGQHTVHTNCSAHQLHSTTMSSPCRVHPPMHGQAGPRAGGVAPRWTNCGTAGILPARTPGRCATAHPAPRRPLLSGAGYRAPMLP